MHSLTKLYDNQKKKKNTRKLIAQNSNEVYKTGGGKIEAPAISTIDIATLEVMNATSVNGHNNDYDDDPVTITNDILSDIQFEYEESDVSTFYFTLFDIINILLHLYLCTFYTFFYHNILYINLFCA